MSILTGSEIKRLIREDRIKIKSIDPSCEFNLEDQVTEDAIDLRLAPYALKYKDDVRQIDTLQEQDIYALFEEVLLPKEGFLIKCEEVIFCQTLDIIVLPPDLCGRVNARTTYSRFGLSVHLSQPKFPVGGKTVFPLQLVNHNKIPLRIYPYAYIVQLQIETTQGQSFEYQGEYQQQFRLSPPRITNRDRSILKRQYYAQPSRTLSMLIKEMEPMSISTKQLDRNSNKKITQILRKISNKRIEIFQIIIGILAGISLNILSSLLTTPDDTSYWKVFATVTIVVLTLLLLIIEIWLLGLRE